MTTATEQKNLELMQTLDDAWNSQDSTIGRTRLCSQVEIGPARSHAHDGQIVEETSSTMSSG